MRAFYLVRIDLQARHGVRFAGIAHEEVAAGLVGVRVVGILSDEDEAREDCACVVVKGIFKEQVRIGTFRNMMLEGTLVVFLFPGWDGD